MSIIASILQIDFPEHLETTTGKPASAHPESTAVVVRHNKLIESKHLLSLPERRFVLWIVSKIKREDADFHLYRLPVQDFVQFAGLEKSDEYYSRIVEMANGLTKRNLGIKDDKSRKYSFFPWFHRIDYKWGEGVIEAILHPDLKPYLLQLKEQYTAITLEYALLLRSGYAHRIYDLLKQYQSLRSRTILLADLREMLAIDSREYPKYADFRKRVLETAQREINSKTDISFDFEPLKDNRKITAIFFRIHTTEAAVTLENPEETDDQVRTVFQALTRHGVAERTARALVADYDVERIKWHITSYEKRRKDGKASSIGWLVDGIKNDYRPQASIFEKQEAEKRSQVQEERAKRAAIDAEVERLEHACDEDNRKAGVAFLQGLAAAERERLDGEFLAQYGDVPRLGTRLKEEGLNSPLVVALYLIFCREKFPDVGSSYLQYAQTHKESRAVIDVLMASEDESGRAHEGISPALREE